MERKALRRGVYSAHVTSLSVTARHRHLTSQLNGDNKMRIREVLASNLAKDTGFPVSILAVGSRFADIVSADAVSVLRIRCGLRRRS